MIWLDTETYSEVPINRGTYKYTANCEAMIWTSALDDGPVIAIDLTNDEHPYDVPDLKYALDDPEQLATAHNSMFDRNVLKHAMSLDIAIPRWRDTMVQAFTLALPGSLDKLCGIFKVNDDLAKMKDGKRLINLFCKPRPKNMKVRRATRLTHPEDWASFIQYAINDTAAMREIARKMPTWNYKGNELDLWHLDQQVNDRGFAVDLELAEAALKAVDLEQAYLRAKTIDMTDGEVSSTTKRDVLLEHILESYGFSLPNLTKDTVERIIDDPDIPDGLRELLKVRLQASMTSTAKYSKIIKSATGGRVRGTIQFCGAGRTGRAAGRICQPQNWTRPTMKLKAIATGIDALKAGCADLIYINIMLLTSNTIRGCIIPPPGKKLVVSDLSNIEGRGVSYLAGEEWKLRAFRDFDAGIGEDLYKVAYGRAFKIDPAEAVGDKRQIGKVMELMLAYQGGVGAYLTGAATYRIDLEHMTKMARPGIPEEIWNEAVKFWHWSHKTKRSTFGLSHDVFCACDSLKRMWRLQHPAIESFWGEIEDVVRAAIREPKVTFLCRKLKVRRTGEWLRIVLPSGRALCYPSPRVDDKGVISYEGVNQFSRKWCRIKTYGGKLVENCIAENTPILTSEGWLPIQSVTSDMLVWDGVEFVTNEGVIYKGNQVVLSAFCVTMTPDHLVLTDKGWVNASSCEGHNRATCRLPHGGEVPRIRREEFSVGSAMHLREGSHTGCGRSTEMAEEGGDDLLRVHEEGEYKQTTYNPRQVRASRLRGVSVDGSSLPRTYASGVEKLRRAWHFGLRTLVRVLRELLDGYGAYLPEALYSGPARQQQGILTGELRMAFYETPSKQQAPNSLFRHTERQNGADRSRGVLRGEEVNSRLPFSPRLGFVPRRAHVYDIKNCGPRNRFVVRGSDGLPLIVHNCTQAFARDVFYNAKFPAEEAGYRLVLEVHDELITEVPDTEEYNVDGLSRILATNPSWAEGMPLAAAGFETYRYRKG